MKKLIEAINKLKADASFPDEGDEQIYLTDGAEDELAELIQEISSEACGELISSGGTPNYGAMRELETATGCRVVKGESDSFGWLTGVIVTPKGRIVYG